MTEFHSSARVGLFWFSPDYQKIIEVQGETEITDADFTFKDRIDPVGLHAEHDISPDYPRGRVQFANQHFTIYVGADVPDSELEGIKSLIIREFGLSAFRNIVSIKKHYHWNTKS